ncbi:hypothetical protein NLI96_g12057 [Meripilus lineatus]|uniref:Uncharacterized protein n=1 Tax=Meripilus lineatus TaxID=2056292 RepID=A0AAD5UQS6_9APHY|nr:hypothetical protein NLI96_g12057 [Physisporinus lineatus]
MSSHIAKIPKRYILPSTLDEILFWVDLDTNPAENDKARTSYVLYHALPGPNSDGGDVEIQFHLQGFVSACNVHPLGTWRANQGIESAPIAYQYLELSGLEAPETFTHQARPGNQTVSLLKRGDDVTGKAKKMETMWYLNHRIDIHMQAESGKLAPLHHGLLGKGDFVDVLVKVSVHRNVPHSRRTLRVNFAMHQIVLLKKNTIVRVPTCHIATYSLMDSQTNQKVAMPVVESEKMDVQAVEKQAADIAADLGPQ